MNQKLTEELGGRGGTQQKHKQNQKPTKQKKKKSGKSNFRRKMGRSQQVPWDDVEEGQEKMEEIRGSPGKLENTALGHSSNLF